MRVAILLFAEFEALDVYGPVEVFGSSDKFQLFTVAATKGEIRSRQGPLTVARHSFSDDCPLFDVLLVPGGQGTREEVNNRELLSWLSTIAQKHETSILSVCTGAALLAKAGVLNNRSATTNKRAFSWVQGLMPDSDIQWVKQARSV